MKMEYFSVGENYLLLKDSWLASSFENSNLTFSSVRKENTNSKVMSDEGDFVYLSFYLDDSC
jgi:hypothetical protein